MNTNKFFVCPNCGNDKIFRVFTSSFQVVVQSPEMGVRIDESGVLPNLRHHDNFIECQVCLKKTEYDVALDLGKKYIECMEKLSGSVKSEYKANHVCMNDRL